MFFSLHQILELLITYQYWIIFPMAILEGPTVSIVAGALASQGVLNAITAFFVIVAGDIVGDTVYYLIGRRGAAWGLHRWHKALHFDEQYLVALKKTFLKDGPVLLLLGKMQGLGSVILLTAGLAEYPYGRYMMYNILATIVKSTLLIAIGYFFAQQFEAASTFIFRAGLVLTAVGMIAMYFYLRNRLRIV